MMLRTMPQSRLQQKKPRNDESDRTTSATVAAMQGLRPSGDNSFEELIARLLSGVSGERIRRCTAGRQHGVDAMAEVPFAIQDKRYTGPLDAEELLGEITSAAGTHPDLQLWVLVATWPVGAQTSREIVDAGFRQGIGVLILDTTAAEPNLPGVATLAALAATDVNMVLEALREASWRSQPDAPDLAAVEAELTTIRQETGFAKWESRLKRELRELPTWRRLVRSQNAWLNSMIVGDARNAFGTGYDAAASVSRTAEQDLTTWWNTRRTTNSGEVAVVVGDRYDGKTWLVYLWLTTALPRLEVPVFLFSSSDVKFAHGDLELLILRQCERALGGRFARFARDLVSTQRSRETALGPWCLVILDGANEYVAEPEALEKAVLWAVPPTIRPFPEETVLPRSRKAPEIEFGYEGRCALLVTCRARDFKENASWLGARIHRKIELQPYNAGEFQAALDLRGVGKEQVEELPTSAVEMVRRPRYFDLMLDHRRDLARFPAVTTDVLHYLDASDKVSSRSGAGVRQEPEAFKALLARLADRWIHGKHITHADVWSDLRSVTERVEQSLQALKSEGVLVSTATGTFLPDPELLALGMGLFIRDSLLSVENSSELGQVLADLLEPHPDDDEKVRWLRAAVTVAVLADDVSQYPELLQALLGAWLGSRNFSDIDLDDLRVLSRQLLEPTLDLLSAGDSRSKISMPFAEPIIAAGIAGKEDTVARAVRHWCRLVPAGYPRWIGDQEGEDRAVVAERIGESSLVDLGLSLPASVDGRTVRACQRLALFLATSRPTLLRPIDALALVAGRHATSEQLGYGECYAIRRIFRDTDTAWFANEVMTWASKPTATRAVLLRDLIIAADHGDLNKLLAALPKQRFFRWQAPLTRPELAALAPGQDQKEILRTGVRARWLALDPSAPKPPRRWRAALGKAALERFEGSTALEAFTCTSLDDLELSEVEPALAAWAPNEGAHIWRRFIADIPRRVGEKEEGWSWTIDGHAALLTTNDRRTLIDIARAGVSDQDKGFRHAVESGYCCAMAGASAGERLNLLLEHPFDQEWTTLYEAAAAAFDQSLRRKALAAVRGNLSGRQLRRARVLLGYLGGKVTSADVARLCAELIGPKSQNDDEYAVHFLLQYVGVDDKTPASAFGRLVAAAKRTADAAWQYSAFLQRERYRGRLTGIGLARALSAPETARERGASSDVPDQTAVEQGIELLATEVRNRLQLSVDKPTVGESDEFPEDFADAVSEAAFDEWVNLMLALPWQSQGTHRGLLMAIMPRVLRTSHAAARELWDMAYPFQRTPMFFGVHFTVKGGLDWTLRLIHEPDIDNTCATTILSDLIADCRSDSELVGLTLGARLSSTTRLAAIVMDLLDSNDAESRARARFIAGWMPHDVQLRKRVARRDPSRWVERIGKSAIRRLDRERWGREWLSRFITTSNPASRWADGRLFLECSDAATQFWADEILYPAGKVVHPTRRAEAKLLVRRIRAKYDDSDLRENFLGYSVSDLDDVAPPWRAPKDWGDVDLRERHLED